MKTNLWGSWNLILSIKMEKRNRIFFIIGTILSLAPAYYILSWIYICEKYPDLSLKELGIIFNQKALLNLFTTDWKSGLILMCIGIIAGVFLLWSMMESLNNPKLKVKKLNLIVFIINILFTFFIAWGLM